MNIFSLIHILQAVYHELENIDVNWFFISQYLTREKAICSFDIKSVHYRVAIIMHTWVHCYFLWIAQEIELNIHMLLHQQQKMIWCKKNEICTPLIHCVKLMQQYQEQSMRVKFPMYQRNFLILIKLVLDVLNQTVISITICLEFDFII